ncbi:MAG: molybdenum cofactor guanylyltransferase [Solirubrobacterales bacterium]|jgi:molybdopterin-guanine dinucleotide biosynthesis protein A|nr:molybdenum cofactor guanylyltransferase [Solirubrobacterales bacterium]
MAMVAAVLAGGESRRMGEPKAALELEGRTLLERAVGAAHAAGLRPVVVAKADTTLPRVDAERWDEPVDPRHPLAGIVAALRAAGSDGIVALACDTPFVPPRLLRALAERPRTTLVRAGGRLHPLPGRYAADSCAPLADALARSAPLQQALLDLGAEILDEPDGPALLNVNHPQDLEAARAWLASNPQSGAGNR